MNDQPPAAESSVEDRLATFFGAPSAQGTPPDDASGAPVDAGTPPQPEDQAAEEAVEDTEEQAPQEALEEIDWEGEKFQIPAKLKPALMMQADYTRKTQEVKEIRNALEAERFTLQSNVAFQQQVSPMLQQQQQLLSYKEQAKKIDWTALTTDQKIDLDRELRNIDNQLGDLNAQIGSKYQEHNQRFGQAVVHAVNATEKYMATKVQGWNQATGNQLHNYGLQLGVPKEKLATGWFADPVATHVMWKAQQWDQLQAGKPQVANKASNAPPVVKPGSNAVQKSVVQSNYQKARENLKKSGSLDAFATALLASQRKR
jgi:hypothetical protein